MTAKIIDGKKIAEEMLMKLKKECEHLSQHFSRTPKLSVVIVGEDPASHIYVERKKKSCHRIGLQSEVHKLSSKISQINILSLISNLNEDSDVDGILIQLPLPSHLDTFKIVNAIDPKKDIDGLGVFNQGLLAVGHPSHIPCTPQGICHLIASVSGDYQGKLVCVLGRSLLVGNPVARMLLSQNYSVVQVHSKSLDSKNICKNADIVVVATGRKHLVDDSWLKVGSIVIDVGIHRTQNGLCGDVDFVKAKLKASYITPVPGGVGPMTIAYLMKNCINAFKAKSLQN